MREQNIGAAKKLLFKSKYQITKGIDQTIDEIAKKYHIEPKFLAWLNEFNVVDFNGDFCIRDDSGELPMELLLGVSKNPEEDLTAVNTVYRGRVPDEVLIVGKINFGDLLCMDRKGRIAYWNHEVHDLYFDMNTTTSTKVVYAPQNSDLKVVSETMTAFLASVHPCAPVQEEVEIDDYVNPLVPFSDDDLDYEFSNPELFFKGTPEMISIHLKKLELSEKGKQLLERFQQLGLM